LNNSTKTYKLAKEMKKTQGIFGDFFQNLLFDKLIFSKLQKIESEYYIRYNKDCDYPTMLLLNSINPSEYYIRYNKDCDYLNFNG
jgi:hypothetical protein